MKKFYSLFLAILLGGTTVIAAENVVDTITLNDGEKTPCHAESIITRRAGDNDADWTQWLDMGSVNVTYCGAIYTNVNPELPKLRVASSSLVYRSIDKVLKIRLLNLVIGALFVSINLI